MGETCMGEHTCEPPFPVDEVGVEWTCPDCRRELISIDAHAHLSAMPDKPWVAVTLKFLPPGTLGWRLTNKEMGNA